MLWVILAACSLKTSWPGTTYILLFWFENRRVFYTRFYFENLLSLQLMQSLSMSRILFRHANKVLWWWHNGKQLEWLYKEGWEVFFLVLMRIAPRPGWRSQKYVGRREWGGETTFTLENELVMAVKPSQPSTDRSKRWKKDPGIIFFSILPLLSWEIIQRKYKEGKNTTRTKYSVIWMTNEFQIGFWMCRQSSRVYFSLNIVSLYWI